MIELKTILEDQPKEEETRKVVDGLRGYNASQAIDAAHQRLTIFLRDTDGEVAGGLLGEVYWGWLHVSVLWIDDSLRHRGYGAKLLAAAEEEAISRGCSSAFLDTFSFQAPVFYQKLGYQIFGRLDDFPPGHTRFFLKKSLRK